MEIKSTGIKNKSTDGGNHSTVGTDQSIAHTDGNPHPVAASGNPGKFTIKPEVTYEAKASGITEVKGKEFCGSDAAHENC